MTDLTRAGLASVSKNVDDAEGQTRQLIAALERVRAEYQRAMEANRRAGQSYTQELANVQALTGQINGLKEGLKDLEATKQQAGATPVIDADAVARKTSNLRMQFQQVARELPSLAMGPQMFILAISNNLPMLADAIADVRKQNELLKASGQKSVPVWKQLGGALLSWQTALVAGISLLIVYGDEVVSWVKNLFKGEKQVDALAERMKALNDIQREAGLSAAKERSELDVLYKATQDHTRSLEDRNAAADELQRRYPKYFENLSNEAILAGNASTAYKQLTDNILKAAQARAAQDKITKNYERMFQLQRAINADTNWTNRNRERTQAGTATRPVDVVSNMGSLAVRCYVRHYDYEVDGVILCGTPCANPLVPLAMMLCALMRRFQGDHAHSRLFHALTLGPYEKAFPQGRHSWISSMEDAVKAYEADPLCSFTFTLNGYQNLFALMYDAYDEEGWLCRQPDLPFFFVAGEEDPVIGSTQAWTRSMQRLKKSGYARIVKKAYPHARHELFHERCAQEMMQDLLSWMESMRPWEG